MTDPTTALAAKEGPLMNRITRIPGGPIGRSTLTSWRTAMALALGGVILAAGISLSAFGEEATPTKHRGSYAINGRIHVGLFGHPDGKPLTTGPRDMKPSWSKEGDLLVFFRVTRPAPRVPDWKTAICVVRTECLLLT